MKWNVLNEHFPLEAVEKAVFTSIWSSLEEHRYVLPILRQASSVFSLLFHTCHSDVFTWRSVICLMEAYFLNGTSFKPWFKLFELLRKGQWLQ